jgi:hypothetical protein
MPRYVFVAENRNRDRFAAAMSEQPVNRAQRGSLESSSPAVEKDDE